MRSRIEAYSRAEYTTNNPHPMAQPTQLHPPEENPQLIKLSLTMYDGPYVPHVPVGLPHCRIVMQLQSNKREYTHTHIQLIKMMRTPKRHIAATIGEYFAHKLCCFRLTHISASC